MPITARMAPKLSLSRSAHDRIQESRIGVFLTKRHELGFLHERWVSISGRVTPDITYKCRNDDATSGCRLTFQHMNETRIPITRKRIWIDGPWWNNNICQCEQAIIRIIISSPHSRLSPIRHFLFISIPRTTIYSTMLDTDCMKTSPTKPRSQSKVLLLNLRGADGQPSKTFRHTQTPELTTQKHINTSLKKWFRLRSCSAFNQVRVPLHLDPSSIFSSRVPCYWFRFIFH